MSQSIIPGSTGQPSATQTAAAAELLQAASGMAAAFGDSSGVVAAVLDAVSFIARRGSGSDAHGMYGRDYADSMMGSGITASVGPGVTGPTPKGPNAGAPSPAPTAATATAASVTSQIDAAVSASQNHMSERHVTDPSVPGRSSARELVESTVLKKGGGAIPLVSVWKDEATAQAATKQNIAANAQTVADWMNLKPGDPGYARLDITSTSNEAVGTSYALDGGKRGTLAANPNAGQRGQSNYTSANADLLSAEAHTVHTYLERDTNDPTKFHVVTSFPENPGLAAATQDRATQQNAANPNHKNPMSGKVTDVTAESNAITAARNQAAGVAPPPAPTAAPAPVYTPTTPRRSHEDDPDAGMRAVKPGGGSHPIQALRDVHISKGVSAYNERLHSTGNREAAAKAARQYGIEHHFDSTEMNVLNDLIEAQKAGGGYISAHGKKRAERAYNAGKATDASGNAGDLSRLSPEERAAEQKVEQSYQSIMQQNPKLSVQDALKLVASQFFNGVAATAAATASLAAGLAFFQSKINHDEF